MKYALVDDLKTEATKGARGICPFCESGMIAKCGDIKVNHWAHKKKSNCDNWWESETEWHRAWKNHFPTEWQEVILFDDQTGEKHIADICTDDGYVLEFQHSYINAEELKSRESFYKKMIWVVDGTRRKTDFQRFIKGYSDYTPTTQKNVYKSRLAWENFPPNWLESEVFVIMDYLGADELKGPKDLRQYLYLLLPNKDHLDVTFQIISRQKFIDKLLSGELITKKEKRASRARYMNTKKV